MFKSFFRVDFHPTKNQDFYMKLLLEGGFDLLPGKAAEFSTWLLGIENRLRQEAPPGVKFLGIFVVAFCSEKNTGSYRILWSLDSYASLDAMTNANRSPGAMKEFATGLAKYSDMTNGANYSQTLAKRIEDVYFDAS